jgi:hypothetical protein
MADNVVDRGEYHRRQNAEQVTELQRLHEHHEQLCDLGQVGLGPIARQDGGNQQQQKPGNERPERRENYIPLHADKSLKISAWISSEFYDGSEL